MNPGEIFALVTAIGVPAASGLIAIGHHLGKRDAAAPRETVVPPAPQHAGSLLDADLAAIRGRLDAVEATQRLERVRVDSIDAAATKIDRDIAKMEGAAEQRREDRAARKGVPRGASESNG